jgi:steroid delta-isomerase-like uncharacterized protein
VSEEFFTEFLAAWNSHDGAQLAAMMAEDGTYEDLATGRVMDRAAVVDFIRETDEMSSDYRVDSVSMQRSGDRYALEWRMSGINDGPISLMNLPATGKQWQIRGTSVGELDGDGRIKLNRDYWNLLAWLVEVGLAPPPEPVGAQPA